MADAKLTALTAASALAAADLFYVSQSAASRKATGTQLLALVGTAYVPLAGGTMTGALTIASGTLTASAPALAITQTWNNAAVTFKAALVNVTKTASDGAGMLQEWQLGGVSRAYIREDGVFYTLAGAYFATANLGTGSDGNWSAARVGLRSDAYYGIGDSTNANSATQDVRIYRDAAATLAQRNGTNAQTLRVYSSYTDASNFERLSLSTTAGSSVNISAETLGTGGDNLDIVLTPAGTGATLHPVGTFSKPGIGFIGFTGTGMYTTLSGANVVLTGSGLPVLNVAATYCGFPTAAVVGWSSSGSAGANPSDVAFARNAAGIVEVCSGTAGTYRDILVRNVKTNPVAFASLVAAATAGNGARAMITNCSHATFGTAADGAGAIKVPVYSDGASWLVG